MMPQDQSTLAFRIQVCARAFRFPWPSPVSCEARPGVRQGGIAPLQALGARSPPRRRSCRSPLSQYHTPKSQATRAVRNTFSAQRYSIATLRPLDTAGIFKTLVERSREWCKRPRPPAAEIADHRAALTAARAASGQAATRPASARNSRRLTQHLVDGDGTTVSAIAHTG